MEYYLAIKEEKYSFSHNVDELYECIFKWNKTDTKRQILYIVT